jgi:hypothetical protein
MERYREESCALMQLVIVTGAVVEQMSNDEAYLDLPALRQGAVAFCFAASHRSPIVGASGFSSPPSADREAPNPVSTTRFSDRITSVRCFWNFFRRSSICCF